MRGRRCAHENCGCPASGAPDGYCGAYCANAAEAESLPGEADLAGACACGHETCHEEAPDRSGTESVTSTGRR